MSTKRLTDLLPQYKRASRMDRPCSTNLVFYVLAGQLPELRYRSRPSRPGRASYSRPKFLHLWLKLWPTRPPGHSTLSHLCGEAAAVSSACVKCCRILHREPAPARNNHNGFSRRLPVIGGSCRSSAPAVALHDVFCLSPAQWETVEGEGKAVQWPWR
jgi:hypothetical protein